MKSILQYIFKLSLTVILVAGFSACGNGGNPNDENPLIRTNMVGHWSHVAVNASGYDHSAQGAKENLGPTRASRAEAIVHIAMFDAANAAAGYPDEAYLMKDVVSGASVEAAVAQAANDTLSAMFPSQANEFAAELVKDLAGLPDGDGKIKGIELGKKAASLILDQRRFDGSDQLSQSPEYNFSQEPGKWRVDPLNPNQKAMGVNWDKVRPFAIDFATQFRAPPPPLMSSNEYAESYAEVFRLGGDGITTPTDRTEDQTDAGIFWAYDGTPSLCAPPRLYNQVAMQIAHEQGVESLVDLARLLALLNVSLADAGITSWETKYFYSFWRPVGGIREASEGTGPTGKGDGNSLTVGDSNWTPLGAPASNLSSNNFTPPFPAYVSGHATFGGALFQTLRNYFGHDNIPFTFVSDEMNGITAGNDGQVRPLRPRSYANLTEAEEENGQSRIYLGIHWSFDKVEGTRMGNRVANEVYRKLFRPRVRTGRAAE
jgi:hypothetical protein